MKQWKRLTLYLFLNVLVSACTTFGVLLAWDRTQHPAAGRLIPPMSEWFGRGAAATNLLGTPTPRAPAGGEVGTPPAPGAVEAAPTPTLIFVAYQVQSGDDFTSIARAFGVSAAELIAVNGFTKDQPLGAGEVLRIPVHPEGGIVIDSVVGAGDINTERVLIRHVGEGELPLVGWRLEDEGGNTYIFPQSPELTLFKDGAVNVYTHAGTNTVVDLFWGLEAPVWSSGETVTLRDPQGEVRATYLVP